MVFRLNLDSENRVFAWLFRRFPVCVAGDLEALLKWHFTGAAQSYQFKAVILCADNCYYDYATFGQCLN